MPGISLADNLVIGMTCDQVIKLKLNPFQACRPPGMTPHQKIRGISTISFVIFLK
jgi:hypothetical protein